MLGNTDKKLKLGPLLILGLLRLIHLISLILSSFIITPFRAILVLEYLVIIFKGVLFVDENNNNNQKKSKLAKWSIPLCLTFLMYIDYYRLNDSLLSDYVKHEILPELGLNFLFPPTTSQNQPLLTVIFGYTLMLISFITKLLFHQSFNHNNNNNRIQSILNISANVTKQKQNQLLRLILTSIGSLMLCFPFILNLSSPLIFHYILFLFLGLVLILELSLDQIKLNNFYKFIIIGTSLSVYSFMTQLLPMKSLTLDPLLFIILTISIYLNTNLFKSNKSINNNGSNNNLIFQGLNTKDSSLNLNYFLNAILESKDSRQIFYFLCLNLSYMFVQLAYGFWTNSLGLISDAIHMFFDCVALGVGLFAAVTSKWRKDPKFTYGYSRVEIISGFSNGIFLALISIFIILEAIGRLIHPPNMNTDQLLLVSFLGLVVNLIGILAFNHGHAHSGGGGCDHGHSHNMQGVFLHILADTLGSVGVIISTLLIQYTGWIGFDPLASIFIAVLIFLSVLPLITSSFSILLLRTDDKLMLKLNDLLTELQSQLNIIVKDMKVWPNTHGESIAVITIHGNIDLKDQIKSVILKECTQIKDLTLVIDN